MFGASLPPTSGALVNNTWPSGSAIARRLATEGCEVQSVARDQVDLTRQAETEDWMAAAQSYTTVDLGPFFRAWIYSPTAPARTAANGFR